MDSAGSDPLRAALVQQGALLGQHATQLNTTAHEMDALNARVAELLTRIDDLQREAANRGPALRAGIPLDPEPHANNFIPLPKLPSARETAQLMVDHVFRLHGLPVDVVSDRGPQFASRFWKEFCRQIGASASLSSGFHPQTNGQCERANQDLERMLRCLTYKNRVHGANSSLG